MKNYLLGTLPETETTEMDLRVISDEALSEELSLAEHDLVEDYLEDGLSPEETKLFKSAFLTSPQRRALLRETSLLKNFAKKYVRAENETGEKAFEGKVTFWALYFRPLLAAGAGAAIFLTVLWFYGTSRSPLEKQYAELNEQDLSDVSRLTEYSSIDLAPGTFRGAGPALVRSQILTDTVLFRLALPADVAGNADLSAAVDGGRTPAFELDNIRAYRGANGQELRILVPRSILQPGQYQINVRTSRGGASVGTYTFVIE